MNPVTFLVLVLAAGLAACAPSDEPGPPRHTGWALTVEPAPLPASADSAQPYLSVSPHGVIASWLDHDGSTATLRFAERTASGWSDARTVASGDDWFVSWADVPSVIRLGDGTLVAHWYTNTDPRIEAYDLWLAHSRDEGATWSDPFMAHDDGTITQHGFATLFERPDGGLGLVWLDGRTMELDPSAPPDMALRFAAYDTSWAKVDDVEVDNRVCECCTTAVALTSEGLITAYRDRSLREVRDIHVSRLEDGAWTFGRPVSVDNWRINACPVNGPALSAEGHRVAAAWFMARDNEPRAFAAFSGDAGRTWADPIRLDDSASTGHVGITWLDDGSVAASWVELAEQRARFHVRRLTPDGERSPAIEVGAGGRVSGYPRMVRHGDELVFAWTESAGDGSLRVRAAVASLPRP